MNHVYTTETLGKELGKEQKSLCKRLLMKHYHDKGLLGWLDGEMAPLHPRILLNKQIGPEQWDIWKLAASTEELGTWTRHFTGPVLVIVIISFSIINHISYKLVFPFLLL